MNYLISKKLKLFIVVQVVKIKSTGVFFVYLFQSSVSHLNCLYNYWLFPSIVVLWLLHLYMDKWCCFEKVRQVAA